jgi:ElaB/YqjD/DUF883 family membrane-anchored ribosome-binding protein
MPDRNHNHIDDRIEQLAQDAGRSVSELGREARKRADQTKTDVAKQLFDTAATMRKEVRAARPSRDTVRSVDNVAKGLERAGHYLRRHSYEDMGDDATRAVQANPWRILVIALAIGIFVGLILRGNDNSRRPSTQNGYGDYNRYS